MPGSSLWLLPPSSSPLNSTLSFVIEQTASHFASPHLFLPHVTLTSEVSPATHSPDPQKWLDSLLLPHGKDVTVKLGRLQSEDAFVRKLYSKVEKEGVVDIGKISRMVVEGFGDETEASKWAEEKYMPHLSLL